MRASAQTIIDDAIEALIGRFAGLPDTKNWLVALSGGADSTALLHILMAASKRYDAQLCALIVNHNLRPEAAEEAEEVARLARAYGIEAKILRVTAPPPMAARQEWARQQRYQLLCSYARRHGGILWLAHHLDDQCETIAMRLAHDSGLQGLEAMKAHSYHEFVPILRPLLEVPKADLVAYCEAHNLSFVQDPSNENAQFERVRWRRLLAQDSALGGNLAKLGRLSKTMNEGLERALAAFWRKYVRKDLSGHALLCDAAAFADLPEQGKIIVMRKMLRRVGAGGYPASIASVKRLLQPIADGRDATLAACHIRCEAPEIAILPEAGRDHEPLYLGAGAERLYRGRLLVRTPKELADGQVILRPMHQSLLAMLAPDDPYRVFLGCLRPEIRMIFPFVHTLDDRPITPHINNMVQKGYFSQLDWPTAQVAIYSSSGIARDAVG